MVVELSLKYFEIELTFYILNHECPVKLYKLKKTGPNHLKKCYILMTLKV